MGMPFIYTEPEVNSSEPHDVKFKPNPIIHFSENNTNRYAVHKTFCEICGATEESEICNRTFYN